MKILSKYSFSGFCFATFIYSLIWTSPVTATSITVTTPDLHQSRYSGFLQPTENITHAYLIYGFNEPPSAAGAGVSPFIEALVNPVGNTVNSFQLSRNERLCLRQGCAYTILGVVGEGTSTASVLAALSWDAARIAIDGNQSFAATFSSNETDLLTALLSNDTSAIQAFFLDNIGRVSGAGVSPFLPDVGVLSPGAAPTPYPDCPPLSTVGSAPTPYPDCPGPATLVSFGNASYAGVANMEVTAISEPASISIMLFGLLILSRFFYQVNKVRNSV